MAASEGADLPGPLATSAQPALHDSLHGGSPVVLERELAPVFGGDVHLVVPLRFDGVTIGALVVADPAMPPAPALEMLSGAVPLAAAHLRTWIVSELRERELREARLVGGGMRELLDSMTDAVRIVDIDGRVVRWNRACERLFGWTEEEVVGRQLPSVPPERRAAVLAELKVVATTMRPIERVTHHFRKDGSRVPITVAVYPFTTSEGQVMFATIVTEVGTDRLDRLRDDFVSLVSDSMKAPLTAILGYTQLLGRSGIVEDQVRRRQAIEALHAEAEQMATLVDDLLLMSEVQKGEMQLDCKMLDLAPLVMNIVAEFEQRHADRRFAVDVDGRIPPVFVDERRMRQALGHLLANAATYAGEQGEVTVSVAREGKEAVVTVADRGPGIAEEDLPHVLGRFSRGAGARGQGAGLGLYVVRLVAQAHGGTLCICSAPGDGCAVALRLAPQQR